MKKHNYFVYILTNHKHKTLYIGVTNNLERRISEHKLELIEGFTKKYKCKKLIYYENFSDINQAISREKYLKGKTRNFKEELIQSINPIWKDLNEEWI